jgi:hypothetical protein
MECQLRILRPALPAALRLANVYMKNGIGVIVTPIPIGLPLPLVGTVPIDIPMMPLLPINAPRTVFVFIEVVVILVMTIVLVMTIIPVVVMMILRP